MHVFHRSLKGHFQSRLAVIHTYRVILCQVDYSLLGFFIGVGIYGNGMAFPHLVLAIDQEGEDGLFFL